jgi:hypothetical protein
MKVNKTILMALANLIIASSCPSAIAGPLKPILDNINTWTSRSLIARFAAGDVKYVGGEIKTITFSNGSHSIHGDQCKDLILEVLRGNKNDPDLYDKTKIPNVDYTETGFMDHVTGCILYFDAGQYYVKKDELTVLIARYVESKNNTRLILEIKSEEEAENNPAASQ